MPSTGGEPKKLLARPGAQFPDTWSPDGRFLVFEEGGGDSRLVVLRDGTCGCFRSAKLPARCWLRDSTSEALCSRPMAVGSRS